MWFIRTEQNGRIHLISTTLVVILGLYLEVTALEWLILSLCIGAVLSAELLNTAVEKLCDLVMPEVAAPIRRIKDMAAAGVLVISLSALVAGMIIFIPRVVTRYQL